ncbi:hypothetical protein AQUCO_02800244v1 [Aquilegia coerulea]|uniref:Uncharacterized protein n=1 Tax=Aquilegia coerulea TaxID=218851 RepID=A0A2G5D4I4_AQUCA|nr:hypothetical protein AQUCO_02800244v1 [Aquilegia coerulea]
MLSLADPTSFQELDLIDKIQRLGVAYHFEDEIEYVIQQAYNDDDYTHFMDQNVHSDKHADLCYVSLRFRLLRQAGYYVSTDVFKKFKDEKGEFHAKLASDVQGMLSLYEASYLGFSGEDIMDEAMVFTTKHLDSLLTSCSSYSLVLQAKHALAMPIQGSVARSYARHYISIYQQDISRNETLHEFAKLDYNAVQFLHRKEINEVQIWWKRMNIKSKLQFDFRDRVVEAYAITNSINFEPQFSQERIYLAKIWTILSIVDDAFDLSGNLDEVSQLCDAFQRWDAQSTSNLSAQMKVIFLETLNLFNEFEKRGNSVGASYFRHVMQLHIKILWEEIKVIFSGDVPTFEKWLSVSTISGGHNVFLIAQTMNMGEVATKKVIDWTAGHCMPKIMKYSNTINRIVGDIASIKLDQARGTDAQCVSCYMMDYGVSESEAIESLQKIVIRLQKVLNEEGLRVHPVPMRIIKNILHFNRSIDLYYKGVDGHSVSDGRTKQIITSLFIDPIPV